MLPTDLIEKFRSKSAIIGVIGIGYVGLPLALTFAGKNFSVVGFDVDGKKVESLNGGSSYISHISGDTISDQIEAGRFSSTSDFSRLQDVDAIIICVPTPLAENREPDLSYVESTADMILPHLRKGQLVVLESTTYPGCTDAVVKPRLEANGLKSGSDFYLAYSPEREDPGNPDFATARIPKVVGGDGPEALEIAKALYDEIVVQTVPVSSMDVAEAVKLTENIFRSVNIALVNELKTIYRKMGVDIWEVIEAAKTKPFGYMPFYPGPGLGGHCIPIDPFYLTWRAEQVGEETKFIELAGEINTSMPEKVVDVLTAELSRANCATLADAHILVVGLAYKKNVNDTRESPAFVLIELLEAHGANVDYYDPFVSVIPLTRDHISLSGRHSIVWNRDKLREFDVALICTDHEDVPYQDLLDKCELVVDTRNVTDGLKLNYNNVVKA